MGNLSKGKYALFISDRSGLAFPYREMVREWNGARVHTSEYEPKQPQLEPTPYSADPQGLPHPRPQQFNLLTGGGGGIIANLTLPGDFGFQTITENSMTPANPNTVNNARQALISVGSVIINIS
tara:strand:+ start:268 stop:639 length:372 start_codon:yes stop_codon:yes gene_type:complete